MMTDKTALAIQVLNIVPADTKLRNGKKLLKAAVDTLLAELKHEDIELTDTPTAGV